MWPSGCTSFFNHLIMAKIKVVGSSSAGNGYTVEANGEVLLLECGVKSRDLIRAAGNKVNKIVGCLISHIHGDHCAYAKDIARLGIRLYSNPETIEALKLPDWAKATAINFTNKWFRLGDFKIMPFDCRHDVRNFGYIVKHPSFGTLLFGTDTFAYPALYKGIDHYLIEANYSDEILNGSNIDKWQKDRLMISHMSLDYCAKYLRDCEASIKAKTITLIHLSSRHSNADEFQSRIRRETGVPTYIADAGTEIDITYFPNF